jgi:hypothetical protein
MRNLPAALLLLAAASPAQGTFTSPIGLDDVEGDGVSTASFPSFRASRVQYLDGDQRGTARPNIRALRLRRDSSEPYATTMGARIVDLAVVMAHCNQAAASTTFASNYRNGQSTTVYAWKAISVPDMRTQGPFPAPWTQFQVPFDVPFSYDGANDLLWELVTRNNTSTDWYWFDHATNGSIAGGGVAGMARNGGQPCTAAGQTRPWVVPGAAAATDAAGWVQLQIYASPSGPVSSPAVLAFGLGDPNLAGRLCAPVRTSADVVLPLTTDALGGIGSPFQMLRFAFPLPHGQPVTIYGQFGALDPATSQAVLTDGVALTLRRYSPPRPRSVSVVRALGTDAALTGSTSVFCLVAQFVH